jgi:multidrug efflux pump
MFSPIVMTSVSVMLGNLPLAVALDPGAASRATLGIVIIGGVFSSLVLTLLLVPIAYLWIAPKHVAADTNVRGQERAAPPSDGEVTGSRPREPALQG